MKIELEYYATIDLRALAGFKRRGIKKSVIIFLDSATPDLMLPPRFAESGMSLCRLRMVNVSTPKL
jgi:hypothetical protein